VQILPLGTKADNIILQLEELEWASRAQQPFFLENNKLFAKRHENHRTKYSRYLMNYLVITTSVVIKIRLHSTSQL